MANNLTSSSSKQPCLNEESTPPHRLDLTSSPLSLHRHSHLNPFLNSTPFSPHRHSHLIVISPHLTANTPLRMSHPQIINSSKDYKYSDLSCYFFPSLHINTSQHPSTSTLLYILLSSLFPSSSQHHRSGETPGFRWHSRPSRLLDDLILQALMCRLSLTDKSGELTSVNIQTLADSDRIPPQEDSEAHPRRR